MKYLKRFMFVFFITLVIFLGLLFIGTVLNYFDIIGSKPMNILKVIIPLFSLAIGGFLLGKRANKNGYLEGLKLGICFVFIIWFINLIAFGIEIKDIIFYVLLIVSCVFGSMFGINMKKEN